MKQKIQPSFVKGFKYRIYPTEEQKLYLARVFGSCRYVYNRLLAETNASYVEYRDAPSKFKKPRISGIDFCYSVTAWKQAKETFWLTETPAQVIQQPAHHLAEAYQRAFKSKKGFPRFKKRTGKQSVVFTVQSYTLRLGVLRLAKLTDPVKVQWSRDLPTDTPGPCTISRTPSGKYFASFMCEYSVKKTTGTGIIGIDAGITDLAVCSNGVTIANLRHYLKSQSKLAAAQRDLSRKKKGSNNRNKARIRVARVHEHIANQRSNYLHKLTTRLVRENQAIAIESLQVANMSKNHCLAKHILDAAWGTMRIQLTYKAIASQHCTLILADPYFPSTQLCSVCKSRPKVKLGLSVRTWVCEYCGEHHERDHNAAKNLEQLGRTILKQQNTLGHDVRVILTKDYRVVLH